jgi:multicomponent Na+:H+ antiporter subunit C
MAPFRLLELLILGAVLAGFAGLLLRRNLFLKVLSMDVMGSAVVALFVLVGARSGLRSPILPASATAAAAASVADAAATTDLGTPWADPIPQAVILTAIVIGLSIQALLLVVITRLSRIDPSLDLASFDTGGRR